MTPEQAFGQVLRELRSERRLSQEQLAERSRISRPHLSRLESGRNSPSLSMVFQLAKALCVAPADVVGRAQQKVACGGDET